MSKGQVEKDPFECYCYRTLMNKTSSGTGGGKTIPKRWRYRHTHKDINEPFAFGKGLEFRASCRPRGSGGAEECQVTELE